MNYAREKHTATLLTNGQVLVTGGYNGRDQYLSSAELYDPVARFWTATDPMTGVRWGKREGILSSAGQVGHREVLRLSKLSTS
jgi:hypothetical protein